MTRRSRSTLRRDPPVVPWLALAFAIGCGIPPICGTWVLGGDLGTFALAGAGAAAVGGVALLGMQASAAGRATMAVAVTLLGAGAAIASGRWGMVTPDERAALGIGRSSIPAEAVTGSRCDLMVPEEGLPASVVGRVATPARPPPPGSDWLARELGRERGVRLEIDEAVVDADGDAPRRIRGRIRMAIASVGDLPGQLQPKVGDRVEARGWLFPTRPGRNPHPAPRPEGAWSAGGRKESVTATLATEAGALHVIERQTHSLSSKIATAREVLRARIERLLDRVAPAPSTGPPDPRPSLAMTMLFGRGTRDDPETGDHFARSGLSHLVAISGFNFAVLGMGAVIVMRSLGGPWRLAAIVTAAVAAAYLAVVDDEPSVVRAGFVAVAGAAAEACGRRYRAMSLLGAVAMVLLAIDPLAIIDPGFQLTFAAVLALRWAAGPLHERWYGRDEEDPATILDVIVGALRRLLVSSIAVWLVVTPISIVHFGQVSWLGLPLSIIAIPLGGVTIASGLTVAAVACIHESIAVPFAYAWMHLTGALLWIAEMPARWQVPDLQTGRVEWVWAAIVGTAAVAWCRSRRWPLRRLAIGVLAVGWAGIAAAAVRRGADTAVEWTMLDVGDGSCHILRRGADAVVFDAGSLDLPSLGIKTIIPALRAAGIRRIEALIVSHPNLDHFAAVPAILARFPTDRLIVNHAMHEAATREPTGASGQLLAMADAHDVPVEIGVAGRGHSFVGGRWTWLHPHPDARYASDNDGSQVIHVQWPMGNRTFDVVLTGDLETAGVRDLLARHPVPQPDLIELPHHGSWRPAVAAWIEAMRPTAIYQSTGPERWRRDRWRDVLSGMPRWVTCVDGAVRARVEIGEDGDQEPAVRLSRWVSNRWEPCGSLPLGEDAPPGLNAAGAGLAAGESRRRSGRVRPRSPRSRGPCRLSGCGSRSLRFPRGSSGEAPRVRRRGSRDQTTSTHCPVHAASPRLRGSRAHREASIAPSPVHAGSRPRHPPDPAYGRSRTREASMKARSRLPASAIRRSTRVAPRSRRRAPVREDPRAEHGSSRDRIPRIARKAGGSG